MDQIKNMEQAGAASVVPTGKKYESENVKPAERTCWLSAHSWKA